MPNDIALRSCVSLLAVIHLQKKLGNDCKFSLSSVADLYKDVLVRRIKFNWIKIALKLCNQVLINIFPEESLSADYVTVCLDLPSIDEIVDTGNRGNRNVKFNLSIALALN